MVTLSIGLNDFNTWSSNQNYSQHISNFSRDEGKGKKKFSEEMPEQINVQK